MSLSKNIHLTKEQTIKQGSFFTPEHLVKIVFDLVKNRISDKDVIVDFGAGYGAFEKEFLKIKNKIIATDIDQTALDELKKSFSCAQTICENSLLNISREKYCSKNQEIIAIGNPPYNDTTSVYQKGRKGKIDCDADVHARDLGISFFKMYDKIEAKLVCVLHPLAYLIKKANFNSLGSFKKNYKLQEACVFPSSLFENIKKGSGEFPVVAACYERDSSGMDFECIKNFEFKILDSNEKFRLGDFQTIDGIIQKYPDKDSGSYDGLQFYTLRDINALRRNATFLDGRCSNGIKVTLENLYQYAWLEYFKETFNPEKNSWLYGNLSPLYDKTIESVEKKKELIRFVWDKKPIVQKYFSRESLEKHYGKF
ncbi:MAG: rRNA adenine N-6-methyltransferase family protein [Treponema sp.]|nr:rRNA adenine N-6-methyltransferase family protein [Treponema sp.]